MILAALVGATALVLVAAPAPWRERPVAGVSARPAGPQGSLILRPDRAYDAGAINEPSVLPWRGRWWLYYTAQAGGQSSERAAATCLATAPAGADLRDARSWTKRGPVVAAPALEPRVIALRSGGLRMFSSMHSSLRVLDSSDGVHWHPVGLALRAGEAGVTWWAASSVLAPVGGLWRGLFEGGQQAGPWHIYSAHSTDGVHFTLDSARPLAGLAIGRGGMEGGPDLLRTRTGYALYYHAASDGGWSAIDLYRATSRDLRAWTPAARPLLRHGTGFAIVDNPSVVQAQGRRYLFWGGGAAPGGINVARLRP